ncbi:MAG: Ig-like domain-containing protein [Bacteroidales bacterium]|nr:Ig-like domain-containing protein [Bacteroidales bacterium]MDT8431195.1 Ig-like domain-containing protein [Bacteroidales bacterium]
MRKYLLILFLPVLPLLLLAGGCAQQGAPTGGTQDEDPPDVVKTEPKNYSANFNAKRIEITFDEYLDMANFTQELVVSPPMETQPEIRMRRKTLIIEFEEELKEDVTYTFNFGEAIKDLNEQNVLLNYEYVFSTGATLDSLSVKGTLKNAFDLTIPETPINVMLYTELADTMPLKQIPYYVGRTDKEGNFAVNNLRKGVYKLFVLKDGNNNFLFDLPTEQIAFLDTSLLVDADYFRRNLLESGVYDSSDLYPDTTALAIDTTGMSADSIVLVLDSLERQQPDFNSLFVDLYMFTEDPTNQYIMEYARTDRQFLEMVFQLPLTDSFSYKPVFPAELSQDELIAEFGRKRDSLGLWLADTTAAAFDTVGLELRYTVLDSMEMPVTQYDTLMFTFREKSKSSNTRRKGEDQKQEKKEWLQVQSIRNRGKHHIEKDLVFTAAQPVGTIDPQRFELYIIPDTVEIPVEIQPYMDTSHLRRVRISHPWKEEAKYKLVMYPGAITNIYGLTNDTTEAQFQIRPLSEYGRILLTLEEVEDTILIQLFKKNTLVRQRTIASSGTYTFEFMDPDTYRIKFIHDRNNNREWDTGKYIEGLQPERVEYLPKDLQVRANWDHDITYVMGSNDDPPGKEKAGTSEEENRPLFQ